jgi:hypothetical protein
MDIVYSVAIASVLGGIVIFVGARNLPRAEARWLEATLVAALLLRLLAAAMFSAFPETRIFHEDADGYEEYGMRLAMHWHGVGPSYLPFLTQNYGYRYVTAAIYFVFGQFRPLASCINCVIGLATVAVVYRMARIFFHQLVARRTALWLSFIPSMILWSSVAMKDALVTLLIVLALYCCISLKRRFTIGAALTLAGCLVAVQPLRFYMLYFLAFAVVVSLFMETGSKLVSGVYKQLMFVGILVGMLVLVGVAGRATEGAQFLTLARVSSFRHGMATTANSGFDVDVDVSTPSSAIAYLPFGMAELMLSPFPWQLGSLRALLAAPETVYWWLLFPSMLRGVWWMSRKRFGATSPLLVFAVTLSCAYSLVHGNVGSGFRQRAQIFVVLFIFTALGSYQKKCQRAGLDPDLLLAQTEPPPATTTAAPPARANAVGSA